MNLLRSECQLLLLRNEQLESDNCVLQKQYLSINNKLINEIKLNKILENIKCAQNEYISKLNNLLIELTEHNGREEQYLIIKKDINKCLKVCKQLQNEYEICKSFNTEDLTEDNLICDELSETQIRQMSCDSAENLCNQSLSYESEDEVFKQFTDYEDHDEDEDENDLEMDLEEPAHHEEEEEDSDPNGAGEQYIDANDKEFVPKNNFVKNARKSFTVCVGPKQVRQPKKSYKSSQKFGDKYRCNWKGCTFISSYKQNVERHYRVHTGERPFKCLFKGCGFSASQAGNLKVHQQRHGHLCGSYKVRAKSTNSVKSPKKLK